MFRNSVNVLCLLVASVAGPARPQEVAPAAGYPTYALLVGSNRPGVGQQALRYAGQDALQMQAVLTEIGNLSPAHSRLLVDPDAGQLRAALDELAAALETHRRRDEPVAATFYYSGHARAEALVLGDEEFPLGELRQRLLALPATVTLVVLDACQSGALSGVKGAGPAAEFSHNSVAGLTAEGVAVMASSSGSELSQESQRLEGSVFTHHLVVGLRGAADGDGDGRVTLSEAYRYAYDRTLATTAATAVGRQHVTLENELRGKGEVVLSWPAAASARLVLPAELAAEVLLLRQPAGVVVAEVYKAAGSAVRLALPGGEYGALVRRADRVQRCELVLLADRPLELDPSDCPEVELEQAAIKGAGSEPVERWGFEFALGGFLGQSDAYTARLDDFGFGPGAFGDFPDLHFGVSVAWSFHRYVALVATFGNLDAGNREREIQGLDGEWRTQTFDWATWRLGLSLRGQVPLFGGWLVPYLQAGGGLTLATTDFDDGNSVDQQLYAGYYLGAAAGLQLVPRIGWWHFLGVFVQAEASFAPTIDNLTGEQHDSGGLGLALGLRGCF